MGIRSAIFKYTVTAVIAVAAGYLGSAIHDWRKTAPETIRARRFEVADPTGRLLSFWGPDGDPQIPATTPKGVLLVFMDPGGVRRCQIGSAVGNYGPELKFYDKFGPSEINPRKQVPEPRFQVALFTGDDPELAMRGRETWRIILGAQHGDVEDPSEDTWSLRIRGGTTSEARVTGYKTFFGQYGAGMFVRDQAQLWSLPPDLQSRWNRPSPPR